jgi:opacity protein-like surface antigen
MSGNVSPYLVLGLGLMYANADGELPIGVAFAGESVPIPDFGDDDSDTRACWKVGLGVDWWATPNVTVGLEGTYVAAFGDHEFDLVDIPGVDVGDAEIGLDYFNIGLGIAYHF